MMDKHYHSAYKYWYIPMHCAPSITKYTTFYFILYIHVQSPQSLNFNTTYFLSVYHLKKKNSSFKHASCSKDSILCF